MSSRYLLLFLLLIRLPLMAQDKSNRGREFWLAYGHNVLFSLEGNSQTLMLYLSAEEAATVTVSVNGTTWSRTVSIPANTVNFSIAIPKSGAEDARIMSEGLSQRGIHILSDVPIVAYAHQFGISSSGATMLMPVETFGYTYYSLNYNQVSNYPESYSWFYAVASENNTRLQITPSDSTQGGWLPAQTYTVELQKGEVYTVWGKRSDAFAGKDMTGSKIVSVAGADGQCHPVAVFSGSSRITICAGNGGEFMQQQIFPASAWGTKYLTYHNINDASGNIAAPFLNIYRVAVRNPSTVVKINGVALNPVLLRNNFYYEFSSSSGDLIEADQPILVAQYTVSSNQCSGTAENPTGDPEMIYISPIEQGLRRAMFYNTRNQGITLNYVNIIVPANALPSLRIDGEAVLPSEFIPHPATNNYVVVAKRLLGAAMQHSIVCDSAFIATNYGMGIYESYGYNVGTLVNNLNAYSRIKNVWSSNAAADTVRCTKSPLRFSIQLAYRASQLHWRLSEVAALSPNTDSIILNPVPVDSTFIHGRRYYTYTLQQDFTFTQPGIYDIPVEYRSPDIDNCAQTEKMTIRVAVVRGPLADFSFDSPVCVEKDIRFTASAASGFTLASQNWLFSDNSSLSGPSVLRRFSQAGEQAVRYSVLSESGCLGDTVKTITIHDKPLARFAVEGPFCKGDGIKFNDQSSIGLGSIDRRNWNFGDGQSASRTDGNSFQHVYVNPGDYTASLSVQSVAGCQSEPFGLTVKINAQPIVNAGADKNIRPGNSIMLDATVEHPAAYQLEWTPASSLSASNLLNPMASPTSTTVYTLNAVDPASQCSASDEVSVGVVTDLYIPTAFTPNGDGRNDVWDIPGLAVYPDAVVNVYNRWGEKIYESKGLYAKPWNGRRNGVDQPNDVYVYLIRLKKDDQPVVKGTVTIIR